MIPTLVSLRFLWHGRQWSPLTGNWSFLSHKPNGFFATFTKRPFVSVLKVDAFALQIKFLIMFKMFLLCRPFHSCAPYLRGNPLNKTFLKFSITYIKDTVPLPIVVQSVWMRLMWQLSLMLTPLVLGQRFVLLLMCRVWLFFLCLGHSLHAQVLLSLQN